MEPISKLPEVRDLLERGLRERWIATYGDAAGKVVIAHRDLKGTPLGNDQIAFLAVLKDRLREDLEELPIREPLSFLAGTACPGAGVVRNEPSNPGGPEGTLGVLLHSQADPDSKFFLAASHVISNFWSGSVGDQVSQVLESGPPARMGTVHDPGVVKPLVPAGPVKNKSDCGLIAVDKDPPYPVAALSKCDFAVGPSATGVKPGDAVQKCGFTTDSTFGTVLMTGIPAVVEYYEQVYYFDNQILVKGNAGHDFARPGDSGSVVVTQGGGNLLVGKLFAGSITDRLFVVTPVAELEAYWTRFGLTR